MMFTSPTLARVVNGNLCSGCGACAAIAPGRVDMDLAEPGFLRPVERGRLTPEDDQRIAAACPGSRLELDAGGRTDDLLWGPLVGLRTGFATDEGLRRNASSGGALSAILTHLLETGTVDAVIQTRAARDLPIANATVVSTTPRDVFEAAGSRYAPSAPLARLEDHLSDGRRFAFVGKPCDVAALRALAREDSRIDASIPVMVSFFCAGVPSLAGARKVLQRLGVREEEVTAFRYRGDGWPGYATATLAGGQTRRMSYADSWGGILSSHVQLRCRICPDGIGSFADIVCADAWETDEQGYPLFEEADGVSLVLSRTDKGEAIVRAAIDAGAIRAEPLEPSAIFAMQPGQVGKRRYTLPRLLALRALLRPVPHYAGFHLVANARRAGLVRSLRQFGATLRRALSGRF